MKDYDAEYITTQGLQNISKEYQASRDQLKQELAQRGMDNSGLYAETIGQSFDAEAKAKAMVRAEAPLKAIQAQQSWYGTGQGLESSLIGNINSAYSNQANIASNQAIGYGNQAAAANQSLNQKITGCYGSSRPKKFVAKRQSITCEI